MLKHFRLSDLHYWPRNLTSALTILQLAKKVNTLNSFRIDLLFTAIETAVDAAIDSLLHHAFSQFGIGRCAQHRSKRSLGFI